MELALLRIRGPGWFLNCHAFTTYVKLAFFGGTLLCPVPLGESKHKEVRYLDIHRDDQLDEAQLATWIRQAARSPRLGPVAPTGILAVTAVPVASS